MHRFHHSAKTSQNCTSYTVQIALVYCRFGLELGWIGKPRAISALEFVKRHCNLWASCAKQHLSLLFSSPGSAGSQGLVPRKYWKPMKNSTENHSASKEPIGTLRILTVVSNQVSNQSYSSQLVPGISGAFFETKLNKIKGSLKPYETIICLWPLCSQQSKWPCNYNKKSFSFWENTPWRPGIPKSWNMS